MALPMHSQEPALQQQPPLRVGVVLSAGLGLGVGGDCPTCRRGAERLRELEQANEQLRCDAERAARHLKAAFAQLSVAQGQAPWPAPAGALPAACIGVLAQHLGARERQVLQQIADGRRTPEIASRMGIAGATVEVHRRNIMRKLGLHSVAQLTKYALREGMTSL